MQRLLPVALVLWSVAAHAAGPVPAGPAPLKVAILDIRPTGIDDSTAKTFSEILAVEVGKLPGLTVITDAEVASLIGIEQRKQIVGCDDNVSCAAEIAGALGVDKVCTGSMGKVDTTTVLTLRVLDVKTAKVDVRLYETETGGAAAFIRRMPQLVGRLFPERSGATSGPAKGGSPVIDERSRAEIEQAAAIVARNSPVGNVVPGGGSSWLLNKWLWAGVGGLMMIGGGAALGALAEDAPDDAYTGPTFMFLGGVAAAGFSAALCFIPGLGSGGDVPPMDHPFQVIDGAPDRRAVLASPAAPDSAR